MLISDERDAVLGTGGGVVKALPLLGHELFFHVSSRHDVDRRGAAR